MKKLFLLVFVFLQSIFTFGQLKVLSSGKTLIGGTTGTVTGDIQLNLQSGSTHGLTFYNPNSSQNYRLTIDGSSLLLSYNSLSLGYFLSGFNVGGSSNLYEYGGCLNISPYGNDNLPYSLATVANQTYGLALFARNDYSGSTGAGISILSTVGKTADMTFASSLNNSSSYSFYVLGDGSAYTKNVLVTSDETLKTDIKAITTPLSKILKLRGVEYKFIDEEIKSTIAKDESPTGSVTDTIKRHKEYDVPKIDPAIVKVIENEQSEAKHIGFLAQEVEKVLPEVVRTSVNGTKAISYMDIIALLVEGIKEQQQTIETMQNEMTELKKSISNRESHNNRANIKKEYIGARLYQNTPNPFNQNTEIAYELPADTQNAVLYIYNMQGVQIEEYNISDFGVGSITIFGGHLEAGIYLYSLIADGKLIDTKQMVLTK